VTGQLFSALAVVTAVTLFAVSLAGCRRLRHTEAERHGAELYGRMCSVCHGASGEGYKADQAPAIGHPAFLGSVTDDYLRTAISNGRRGTTMSAWALVHGGPLSPDDVDALIAFMRRWQRGPRPALNDRPAVGSADRGGAVFAQECAKCHGVRGQGGQNVGIGNPDLLATASDGFLRFAIEKGRFNTAMPAFGEKLGRSGVEDVLAKLRSFQFVPPPAPRYTPPFRQQAFEAPPRPPPLPLGKVPLNPRGPEPIGFNAWPETTSADVIKGQLDRHARMGLLDARAPSDYTNEHLAGAVSVPFYDPDPYFDKLPKNTWLVCYCACPHAESGQLAQKLLAKGFTKVTVLNEGLGFWKSKKYGTEGSQKP
jgi:cytochrome c oxidase cbb3-type subunit 3/ubiquinol-cytochrome c reductase cytochrome c subunit